MNGKYDQRMRIICGDGGALCAYQRWCDMKGRSILSDGAAGCLRRAAVPQTPAASPAGGKKRKGDEKK